MHLVIRTVHLARITSEFANLQAYEYRAAQIFLQSISILVKCAVGMLLKLNVYKRPILAHCGIVYGTDPFHKTNLIF